MTAYLSRPYPAASSVQVNRVDLVTPYSAFPLVLAGTLVTQARAYPYNAAPNDTNLAGVGLAWSARSPRLLTRSSMGLSCRRMFAVGARMGHPD